MSKDKTKCCENCYCSAMNKEMNRLICMNTESRKYGDNVSPDENCSCFAAKDSGFATHRNGIH